MSRESFDAYVTPAREAAQGRAPGGWRILAGLLLLLGALILGTLLGFLLVYLLGERWPPAATDPQSLLATLLGLAAATPGVWLAARWLHRRSFSRVLGVGGRLRGRGLLEGAIIALLFGVLSQAFAMGFGWMSFQLGDPPATPFWLMLAIALAIPFQAAGEELVFRGYLVQELAARSRLVLVWLAPPALLFTALHLSPSVDQADNIRVAAHILVFALFATALVWLTGGLSQAIGFHAANNLLALLVFEPQLGLKGVGFIQVQTRPGAELQVLLLDIAGYALAFVLAMRFCSRETAPPLAAMEPDDAA